MDNDVLAYRVLLEKRKENAPFWEKKVLTVEEAAEYTGIGRTKHNEGRLSLCCH